MVKIERSLKKPVNELLESLVQISEKYNLNDIEMLATLKIVESIAIVATAQYEIDHYGDKNVKH